MGNLITLYHEPVEKPSYVRCGWGWNDLNPVAFNYGVYVYSKYLKDEGAPWGGIFGSDENRRMPFLIFLKALESIDMEIGD